MSQSRFLAAAFMRVAGVSASLGMILGIQMAISGDHRLAPAHAHLLLIGWVSFFLMGLYYRLAGVRLVRVVRWQFRLSVAGLPLMVLALAALLLGFRAAEPLAAIGSLLLLASFIIFAAIVIIDMRAWCREDGDAVSK